MSLALRDAAILEGSVSYGDEWHVTKMNWRVVVGWGWLEGRDVIVLGCMCALELSSGMR